MPVIFTPLSSIDETISKPVILQVCRNFAHNNHLVKNMEVIYIDHTESRINLEKETPTQNKTLATTNRLEIRSTEEPLEDSVGTAGILRGQNTRVIFSDPTINTLVHTSRIKHRIRLDCKYIGNSKADVQNWVNRFLADLALRKLTKTTNVAMQLVIPSEVLNVLHHVYGKKISLVPSPDNFINYLLKSNKDLSLITNSSRTLTNVVSTEIANNLIVNVPLEPPVIEKDESLYNITFSLEFIFDKPVGLVTKYPIFIGETIIDEAYYDSSVNMNEHKPKRGNRESTGFMSTLLDLNGDTQESDIRSYCYVVPQYDTFKIDLRKYNQIPLLQVRFFRDEDDDRLIANLADLFNIEGFVYNKELLPYIVANKDLIFTLNRTLVNLMILKNGEVLEPEHYYIDNALNIRAKYPLGILANYHLMITTSSNLSRIIGNILPTIVGSPGLVNGLIEHTTPTLNPDFLPKPNPPSSLYPNGSIDKDGLLDVVNKLPKATGPSVNLTITANAVIAITQYK